MVCHLTDFGSQTSDLQLINCKFAAMPKKFDEFKLNRQILNAVEEAGFTEATPIQEKAIGPVLSGQDLFGIAQTGTGKLLPMCCPCL